MPVSRRKGGVPRWTPQIVPRNGALELDAPLFVRPVPGRRGPRAMLRYARDRLRDILRRRRARR